MYCSTNYPNPTVNVTGIVTQRDYKIYHVPAGLVNVYRPNGMDLRFTGSPKTPVDWADKAAWCLRSLDATDEMINLDVVSVKATDDSLHIELKASPICIVSSTNFDRVLVHVEGLDLASDHVIQHASGFASRTFPWAMKCGVICDTRPVPFNTENVFSWSDVSAWTAVHAHTGKTIRLVVERCFYDSKLPTLYLVKAN